MNALTQWNPFRELEDMHNRLAGIFDRSPSLRRDGKQEAIAAAEWSPLVDITEDDKSYDIKVELPEMRREDIKVSVANGVLTISGERKQQTEEKNKKVHRVERFYGSFMRTFSLPEDACPEQVDAAYRDGVLDVTIQKSEKAKPHQVEVKVQ